LKFYSVNIYKSKQPTFQVLYFTIEYPLAAISYHRDLKHVNALSPIHKSRNNMKG